MGILETGDDSGFTLIEVLAVIVLLGVVFAFVYPNYIIGEERTNMKYIGNLISSDLKLVKEETSYNKIEAMVDFVKDGYCFTIGESKFTRSFKRFGFGFIFPEEKNEEPVANPAPTGKPEITSVKINFNSDGTATNQELSWESIHFKGKLVINQDGTVNWHYERK